MFNTTLPLTKGQEKVGERRDRKAQERSNTLNPFETASISSTDHEQWWWASSVKKARSVKTNILRPTVRRPVPRRTNHALPKELDIKLAQDFKDPVLQPGWTHSSTLSPTSSSGVPCDRFELDVPELEGDTSSWQTESVHSRHSYDLPWDVGTPKKACGSVITHSPESMSLESCTANSTRLGSVSTEREPLTQDTISNTKKRSKRRPQTVMIEGSLSLDALKLHDAIHNRQVPEIPQQSPLDSVGLDSRPMCRRMSQWDGLAPQDMPNGTGLPFLSPINQTISTPAEPRFHRFIRQMKNASPDMILEQMKDSLQSPIGEVLGEEMTLERQFWLLTSFETHIRDKNGVPPSPTCDAGRILELYGSVAEVYQWSATQPSQTVHFLTTKLQRSIPLPSNVSYLTTRDVGSVPFPYPENYFSHIRAPMLPSLIPSASLPELFSECYKLLAPGGLLEIRIMDAAPVRKTIGPLMRTWIEDRLSVNLERLFRCSKPCLLVPVWLKDARFELCSDEAGKAVTLPCAIDMSSNNTDKELSMTIARCMWKNIWGSFVDNASDEPNWWWEDEEILKECLERETMIECRTVYAYKR